VGEKAAAELAKTTRQYKRRIVLTLAVRGYCEEEARKRRVYWKLKLNAKNDTIQPHSLELVMAIKDCMRNHLANISAC
jgi:DsbC/DsbD-like thiol-disulfide interchange protein